MDFGNGLKAPNWSYVAGFDQIVLSQADASTSPKQRDYCRSTKLSGDETIAKFKKLKKRCDPNGLLESDLYRRIFKEIL
jgi:hypothetical protein